MVVIPSLVSLSIYYKNGLCFFTAWKKFEPNVKKILFIDRLKILFLLHVYNTSPMIYGSTYFSLFTSHDYENEVQLYFNSIQFDLIFFFSIIHLKELFETLVTGTQIFVFPEMMPIEEWIRLR